MPSDAVLARAALLRAGGSSWESVAAQLRRTASALMRWPDRYGDRWHVIYQNAERRVAVEGTAEGMLTFRQLLRADDDAIRCRCAKSLVDTRYRYVDKLPVPVAPTSPRSAAARRLVTFIENNSNDIPLIPLDQLARALAAGAPGDTVPTGAG